MLQAPSNLELNASRFSTAKRVLGICSTGTSWLFSRIYVQYLKVRFGHIGAHTVIDVPIRYKKPTKISLGQDCNIRRGVVLNGRSCRKIGVYLGRGVSVRESTYVDAYGGWIFMDDHVAIGHRCVLGGHGGLIIGKYTMIGGLTYIIPANHRIDRSDVAYMCQGDVAKGIRIGRNVWIGASCVILDGVTIGDNSVVGAGSVVSRDIPAYSMAVGVPARIIRRLEPRRIRERTKARHADAD